MIVECDHCHTKFNLPDEKLKPEGVKIRCTRCKEIFEVPGPQMNDGGFAADDSIADDAGAGDDISGFEGGDDFSIGSDDDIGLGGDEGDVGLEADDSSGLDMSDDFEAGGTGEGGDFDEMSFDLDTPDSPESGGGDALDFDDSLDLDSDEGGEDSFNLDDDTGGGDSAPGDGLSLDDDSSDLDSDDLSLDGGDEFDIPSLDDESDTTIEEDSSGLDFSSPMGKGGDTAFEFEPTSASDGGLGMGGDIGLDMGGDISGGMDMEMTEEFAPKKAKKSRRSPLMVALLIVLVITLGAYFAFKALGGGALNLESISKLLAGNKDPLDGLKIDETKVTHYYTVNNQAGKILVVEGVVLNTSEIPKGQIKVMIKLYDDEQEIIKNSQSYCGNILNLSELKSLSKNQITKDLNKKVNPANARVEPKTSINFILVIFDVPNMSHYFDIEIVGAENVG
jgi:predicted Zn finger-like uncharacterized protein